MFYAYSPQSSWHDTNPWNLAMTLGERERSPVEWDLKIGMRLGGKSAHFMHAWVNGLRVRAMVHRLLSLSGMFPHPHSKCIHSCTHTHTHTHTQTHTHFAWMMPTRLLSIQTSQSPYELLQKAVPGPRHRRAGLICDGLLSSLSRSVNH